MSQTILIENDSELRKVFSLNLLTYTGTDIIDRNNADEAIELLNILPSINLIVTRTDATDEKNTAIRIYNFLQEKQLDIPMIVLGEVSELKDKVLLLQDPISWEILVKNAANLLGVKDDELAQKVQPKHIPISISYFYDINHTPCDVYIRIKKGVSDFQYVKRLHAQDSFTPDDIDKYGSQGLKDFWIHVDYQQYFVTFVTNCIISKLENNIGLDERLLTNANAYEIVREHIQKAGLTAEISELSEVNIRSMIKAIKEAPKLASLLKFLFSSKISYAYQKAHLTCVISNFVVAKQSWYKEKHLETITYLSFFADITLKSAKQMKINTNEELEAAGLEISEKQDVMTHALDATTLIKEFPQTNEYIEHVLLQHQGSEDGIGFPDDISEEIHPIAKVFIIADAFVKTMLDSSAPKNKKEILQILYLQFPSESFQKIIRALEQKIE